MTRIETEVVASPAGSVLCVDLDGTLVATDTLWESILALVRTRPWNLLMLPVWVLGGKARVKREIARRTKLDVASLPYREEVLELIAEARARGGEVVLATAADQGVADRIAAHLGVFSAVLASDGTRNLSGNHKLGAIRAYAGSSGFDYVGDGPIDVPIWTEARRAILVAPSSRLSRRVSERGGTVVQLPSAGPSRLMAWLRALRVHQWVKNLLVFTPVIMAHETGDPAVFSRAFYAFLAFGLCASGVYLMNDLIDLESDRLHPRKRRRPFASGTLTIPSAAFAIPALVAAAFVLASQALPAVFLFELAGYFAVTCLYSLWIKRAVILDVVTLAGLYTIRVLAGGAATDVVISPWMLAFSMFLFLSLAFMKRYSELGLVREGGAEGIPGRGYMSGDLELLRSLGSASGLLAVLVTAMYVNSTDVVELYERPLMLWLIGPCLLYWISRMWLLAHRGRIEGDPIVFTVTDWTSYVVGALILAIILAAS